MTPKVLVADDERDIRLMVRLRLERVGWEVHEATSGEDALEQTAGRDFDAVVLDQRMSGITGLETAAKLLERRSQQPIVLFSAYLTPDVEEDAATLGIVTLAKAEVTTLDAVLRGLLGSV